MPTAESAPLRGRIPPDLKRRLEEYAADRGLSVNATLILFIEAGLRGARRRTPPLH